ncbi:hypothetical protein ACFFX0_15085 [Citricoccus parietis]|uniref:Uncharacterized protein n=1 Tax=Citricoccus parietis TaxID=592307 RepID=A0ABV5G1U8_9MICC
MTTIRTVTPSSTANCAASSWTWNSPSCSTRGPAAPTPRTPSSGRSISSTRSPPGCSSPAAVRGQGQGHRQRSCGRLTGGGPPGRGPAPRRSASGRPLDGQRPPARSRRDTAPDRSQP